MFAKVIKDQNIFFLEIIRKWFHFNQELMEGTVYSLILSYELPGVCISILFFRLLDFVFLHIYILNLTINLKVFIVLSPSYDKTYYSFDIDF